METTKIPNLTVNLPVSPVLKSDSSGDLGAYTDWTFLRPELADQMAKSTYDEMQQFLQYKNQPVSEDKWNQIQNNVQKFNRVPIINDPKNKGSTLYEK
jgi:hypothetical protein